MWGPYHRLGDTAADKAVWCKERKLCGGIQRNIYAGKFPKAKAWVGPLPAAVSGFEFMTDVKPDPHTPPRLALWSGPRAGVTVDDKYACIPIYCTKIA
jgi:hypothetical protein